MKYRIRETKIGDKVTFMPQVCDNQIDIWQDMTTIECEHISSAEIQIDIHIKNTKKQITYITYPENQ